jgi:altronate dehydratase large subunit
MKIYGFRRGNGQTGIRNHIAVIPTSICSSETAVRISNLVEGTVPLPHEHGCCQVGIDHEQTVRTLIGLGKNPNVAAVLVVALGCEGVRPEVIANGIRESGKPVEQIVIQESGGTLRTIEEGAKLLKKIAKEVSSQKREEFDISSLILGIECGGSDATSGIVANPVVGIVSDMLINNGGTTILSETTEMIGAEHLLAKRAVSEEVGCKLLAMVKRTENRAIAMGVDIRGSQPTPGNIEGGVTTIEEKSLGCIYKAGSAAMAGVLEYGEEPKPGGLFFMDTPGQDIESITGMLAGGAQIIIFTTGRGTPTGSPIAPVIKVTGNSHTYANMLDNIDINAGKVIDEGASMDDVAQELFQEMLDVCNGKLTKAELLKHREFGIFRVGYTF